MKLITEEAEIKLSPERQIARNFCYKYNNISPNKNNKKLKMLKSFLGKAHDDTVIFSPFYCDYGYNVFVGKQFFANYGLTILDASKITIGDNCRLGPNVSLITIEHPQDAVERRKNIILTGEIQIGKDVWIGANAVILRDVKIGDNVIIGAGAVVTHDIPSNTVVAGIPAKVIKKL